MAAEARAVAPSPGRRSSRSTSPRRSTSPSPPPRSRPSSLERPAAVPSEAVAPARPAGPATATAQAYYPPWLLRPVPAHPDPTYHNAPVLSEYLEANFVPSVVPQPDEYAAKEHARQYLEKLADQVSPGAKLLPFGSMANGFALKNSDMDLCCFLAKDAPVRAPSELVEQLGTLIERETDFYVKMLPRARIPIIKLTMPATPTNPEGMACDIGFENRLALENTRLLLTYAMVDPRLRTLVLFLKVWTKRRKINNPYRGTLSSYGYVLLVIHFLCHVKQPPVVPNLQRLPLPTEIPIEDLTYEGHDISFFDDLDQLSTVFTGQNVDSTGELLIDFFKYFANSFDYTKSVISIRSERGTLGKEEKGWHSDVDFDPEVIVRDLHKLCIEDPFALDYNVARTVTKDGLYTIRGEFMRAVRILTTPSPRNSQLADRVTAIMNELCAEREDFLLMHPPPDHHHKQQQYQHASATLQPNTVPISKSPRRRSAPSPQLRPAPPQHPSHHPSPVQQYSHAPMSGQGQAGSQQLHPGGAVKGGEGTLGLGLGHENGDGVQHRSANSHMPPPPQNHRQQHLQPGFYPRTNPPSTLPAQPYHSGAPASVASSLAGDAVHDRRQSSDSNSQERFPIALPNGGEKRTSPGPAPAPSGSSNGYDLHRFFQNPPPSSAMSDTGAASQPVPHARTTVSLTAPPSPDLAPAYFTSSHGYGPSSSSSSSSANAKAHYVGRTPYRYPSSNYPSASSSSSAARHASVPRNAHAAHYTYPNPYASPSAAFPPPLPLQPPLVASSVAAANGGTLTPPFPPPYPLAAGTSTSTMGSASSPATVLPPHPPPAPPQALMPAPIFPAEDRDRIARASSITFGNFPELLPLPSYAHYHASGGSAAYLSGSGGWGLQPYGMGGAPPPLGNVTRRQGGDEAGAPREPGMTTSLELSGTGTGAAPDDDDEAGEGERGDERSGFDGDDSFESGSTTTIESGEFDYTGRSSNGGGGLYPMTPLQHLDHAVSSTAAGGLVDRSPRQRGRSVPQTRMGPDGRESILFGAIEVTLPKPEDVEAAEREEEERESQSRDEASRAGEEPEPEEAHCRSSPPTPLAVNPPSAVESIEAVPTVTTSPPTPAAKPTRSAPEPTTYAWRPLSPLFNSTPVAPPSPPTRDDDGEDDGDSFDLDRTPRPTSPSLLPPLSNGAASRRSSSASDSPRIVATGLSMLSMAEDVTTPATPPRSKHAAKRARQTQRRKVAATQSSSPPPLALTSNSLV
ncbi:hypothetical protein JCM11491_004145 [Sporobolomyces phaffii]